MWIISSDKLTFSDFVFTLFDFMCYTYAFYSSIFTYSPTAPFIQFTAVCIHLDTDPELLKSLV